MARAYAECERRAREHYENFPVASRFLPKAMRPHIAAIYAFARTADDYADEPGIAKDERLRLLDDWARQLAAAVQAEATVFLTNDKRVKKVEAVEVLVLSDFLQS